MAKKYTKKKARVEYRKLERQINKSDLYTRIQYKPKMFFLKYKLKKKGIFL